MIEDAATYGLRRVDEVVEPVDATPYFEVLEQRFGIPTSTFDELLVHRPNRHAVWIVGRDLRLPTRPPLHTIGVPFFRIGMRWPRPTNSAAIRWGRLATLNHIDVSAHQIADLLRRRDVGVKASMATAITGLGYVLIRHRGFVLGLGFYRPRSAEDASTLDLPADAVGSLRSMLPRSWTGQLGIDGPPIDPADWRQTEQPVVVD